MAEQIVVVGLGRFGSALAQALTQAGHEVLAIDRRQDPVRDLSDTVSKAVQGDATRLALWNDLPIQGADIGIVAFISSVEANILTTVVLRKLGFKRIIAKAGNEIHSELLRAIGVDTVIEPSNESALRLAHTLGTRLADYLSVSQDFGVGKITDVGPLKGSTIQKFYDTQRISVLAICRDDSILLHPQESEEIKENDILVIAGKDGDLREFADQAPATQPEQASGDEK